MNYLFIILLIVLLGIAFPKILKLIKHKSLYPFMPYKYNFRRRRITFSKTLQLLNERNAKILVETGTSRNGLKATKTDGGATIVFGKWAKENNAKLHSVDISKDSVQGAQEAVQEENLQDSTTVYLGDSLDFLKNFNESIDFLYLDSYDYSKTDIEIQKKSQEHHLQEFILAEDKLHDKSIVLIDDCRLPGGGKGKTVVEYMLKKDWEILINAYQILLVKK
ncbi:putative O-methyltransferase YrrM [Aquimarina sp. EL_43]|uniref:class I SAM-dependent methyltransferase n=1 Tax=Aquimarina TaxID=290174 RepID=UPI00046FCFC2|nr:MULTISPECIES: class I SAM-dependent methyltransferase [Aquimarina]MBG6132343.1 putative O-methyltransferase YrrM [Aquimarina sp. EL_35]MBG6152474.1 putative O-methyltransferase YrrM [Aquimarina sp. EL_32]MBG6170599.1 putative O-methyltransferase YrrM [Aquimarina sp. EL_43]